MTGGETLPTACNHTCHSRSPHFRKNRYERLHSQPTYADSDCNQVVSGEVLHQFQVPPAASRQLTSITPHALHQRLHKYVPECGSQSDEKLVRKLGAPALLVSIGKHADMCPRPILFVYVGAG